MKIISIKKGAKSAFDTSILLNAKT